MFENLKERIAKLEETNEDFRNAKAHVEKYKVVYAAVGSSAITLVAAKTFGNTPEIKQIIKPKNQMGLGYKSQQIMNTIVLPAKGDPGDVVQNLRTLETYPSKGELAKTLGLPRSRVADYFAGRLPHLQGDEFAVIGKAGHPIKFA